MPIQTTCPGCKSKTRIPDEYANRKINCPECGHAFRALPDPLSPVVPKPMSGVPPSGPDRLATGAAKGKGKPPLNRTGVSPFLRCVGRSTIRHAKKALLQSAPFGEAAYELAESALEEWKQQQASGEDRREELDLLIQASADEIRRQAEEVADEVAPPDAQEELTAFLERLPSFLRHTLAHSRKVTGSQSTNRGLETPEDLLLLLPLRPPRFKPGDSPPDLDGLTLDELLGVGGFGEVWKAHQLLFEPGTGPSVALKFCLDSGAARLLGHEAALNRLISQGRHPGIVALRKAHLQSNPPCLEYEYVEGGDLAGLIRAWAIIPPKDLVQSSLRLMHQIAGTVAFAHGLEPPVIHRDLKPSNILLQPTRSGPVPRVTDFGIGDVAASRGIRQSLATSLRAALTTGLRGAHTPLYASPEQKRGDPADPRDDVYALGVIWYQLLAGHLTREPGAGCRKTLEKRQVPDPVIQLLMSCLQEAGKRLANAAFLREELAKLYWFRPLDDEEDEEFLSLDDDGDEDEEVTDLAKESVKPLPQPSPWQQATKQPRPWQYPISLTNSLGMKFVLVPRGTFWMSQDGMNAQRQVEIEQDFYLGVYPVTQEQWQAVMGNNPSWFSRTGPGKDKVANISDANLKHFPVENVWWNDARKFIKKLNEKERGSGFLYRLPTEAEWEYACRGGVSSREDCSFHFYFRRPTNDLSSDMANFDGNYPAGRGAKGPYLERPTKTGSYQPNRLGLYDMHGNVWEWCQDLYGAGGSGRVSRGGCWSSVGSYCQASARNWFGPASRLHDWGFRLVRVSVK